ncbi:MAG: RdgB/HAM1 family non-canonical purine NTP pyrophosphatase [Acidimicrobiia bacterium]|nr:RdgB/HAM1 family non-canonical purine NTP pyrophosphatase [Acidimicrobiia bacterium]
MSRIPLARLVLATKNPDKLVEVSELVQRYGLTEKVVEGLHWDDVEETASTLTGNALLKARTVSEATNEPALADDTGLEVDALGALPGVRTGRFAGEDATYEDNVRLLLSRLDRMIDRGASFITVVAIVHPDGWEETAQGVLSGTIATAPRGTGGFGYDPVFEVEGRTLSEMGDGEKNLLSHRALAIENLHEQLKE